MVGKAPKSQWMTWSSLRAALMSKQNCAEPTGLLQITNIRAHKAISEIPMRGHEKTRHSNCP